MRLGIALNLPHRSPGEWADKHRKLGLGSVVFPLDHTASDKEIDGYVNACADADLLIAEVGSWCNPMAADPAERQRNIRRCQKQLSLAEYIGARCCVNITGSAGEIWDGGYARNYAPDFQQLVVETIREIIDAVHPVRTFYTLEPMPWMIPDSPENYADLLKRINRPGAAVHLDVVNMISSPERYFNSTAFIERCFRLLGGQIRSCHVKDVRLERFLTFNLKECPCGEGALDLDTYIRKASECDPDMPFILEHLPSGEEYRKSLFRIQKRIHPETSGLHFLGKELY